MCFQKDLGEGRASSGLLWPHQAAASEAGGDAGDHGLGGVGLRPSKGQPLGQSQRCPPEDTVPHRTCTPMET